MKSNFAMQALIPCGNIPSLHLPRIYAPTHDTDLAVSSLVEDRVCPPIFFLKHMNKRNNVTHWVSDPTTRIRAYKTQSKPRKEAKDTGNSAH